MKRVFTKIRRCIWSWGFVKFVLAIVTLIILFYVEEDWRGAHAWATTKAEWEAKGETFDYQKLVPPPVPDDQNLAAIPLFALQPAKDDNGISYMEMSALKRATRNELPAPSLGSWMKGELPDMSSIQNSIRAGYSKASGAAPPQCGLRAEFNTLYPFLTELLSTSASRPICRFNLDYTISPPSARNLTALALQIKLSKVLTLDALLALNQHDAEHALQDTIVNYKLLSGVEHDPTLVGGLVAAAITVIANGAIYDGIAHGQWSDAQLSELEQTLGTVNFLEAYQFAMRGETAFSLTDFEFFQRAATKSYSLSQMWDPDLPVMVRFAPPWPNGWWDDNKSKIASCLFQSLIFVDPQTRSVYPERTHDLEQQIERGQARWDATAPWNILADTSVGAITHSVLTFAKAQTWIDEVRIACALERYHLAHGGYPSSLDALVPASTDKVPHDIMDRQPYHYSLKPDGTYLLYSVGWNQVDDGGKIVMKKDSPSQIDYEQGDWVWPTPRYDAK